MDLLGQGSRAARPVDQGLVPPHRPGRPARVSHRQRDPPPRARGGGLPRQVSRSPRVVVALRRSGRAGSCTLREMLGGAVRRLWIAALAGAVVVAFAACGGDDDEESTGTTATSSASVPSRTLDEKTRKEEAAKDAYLTYWDAYMKATSEPVDPQLPEMQQLMTGDHQRVVTRNLEDRQARGEAVRQPPGSQAKHEIQSADLQHDGGVKITECEVDDAVVYEVATGVVVNDEVVTKLATATMVEMEGTWRIAHSEVIQRWHGVVDCGA